MLRSRSKEKVEWKLWVQKSEVEECNKKGRKRNLNGWPQTIILPQER